MSRKKRPFSSTEQLDELITQYFDQPNPGKENNEGKPGGTPTPTLAGLAFFLGFNSRMEFEACEAKGKYAAILQRARLRIESVFERKLHGHSYGGAVFALKNMERSEPFQNIASPNKGKKRLKPEIIRTGPKLASSEKDVVL